MNDTDFIAAIRELAADHAACDPYTDDWCSLQSDLNQLLKEYDKPVPAKPHVSLCTVTGCNNVLTILDFVRCRQCVLQGRR